MVTDTNECNPPWHDPGSATNPVSESSTVYLVAPLRADARCLEAFGRRSDWINVWVFEVDDAD